MLALLLATPTAFAQACTCARTVALPTGEPPRPWSGVVAVEYGVSLSGETEGWRGFSVTDLHGDSMAGMYMPPHVVHTGSIGTTLGLPAAFSVSATIPYTATFHVAPSEMVGDVDAAALADADLGVRWGRKAGKGFFGLGGGLSFPTGEVVLYTPVRSGRGAFGASLLANGGLALSPKVKLAVQGSGSWGFGGDASGYVVGPTASLVAGATWWPRENGKLNLAFFAMERWSGTDRMESYVYENTGYLTTDVAVAASYTFWAKDVRSAGFTLRAQTPVLQIVGDPMYAENFGVSLGVSVVAF